MNRFPTNYKPKFSELKINEASFLFEKEIKKEIENHLEVKEIRTPLITEINQSSEIHSITVSRPITYDSINYDGVLTLYNRFDYWMIRKIRDLNVKNNHALMMQTEYILRDDKISNHNSMQKRELVIEFRFENEKLAFKKMIENAELIYKLISKVENKMKKQISLRGKKIKENLNHSDIKIVRSRSGEIKNTDKVEEIVSTTGPTLFLFNIDNENTADSINKKETEFSIRTYSKLSRSSSELIRGCVREEYKKLLSEYKQRESKLTEFEQTQKVIDGEYPLTYNITLNLDSIVQSILNLNHILEVQPGSMQESIKK